MKTLITVLSVGLVVLRPPLSYAWEHHGRGEGRQHHWHETRVCNLDVTLVSGMDNIDGKVLVASGDNDN